MCHRPPASPSLREQPPHLHKNTADGETLPGLVPGDPKKAAVPGSALPAGGLLSVEGFQRGEINSLTKTECFWAGQGECFLIKYLMKANEKRKYFFLALSTVLMAGGGFGRFGFFWRKHKDCVTCFLPLKTKSLSEQPAN